MYVMTPNDVAAPERGEDGQLPATKAGEFGAVLLASCAATPTGAVRLVWELSLDRMRPAMLTFTKPKAWLVQRMKCKKGNYYKLAQP